MSKKEKKTKKGIRVENTKITTKLLFSYGALICCILAIGIVAYMVASEALIDSYKKSTEQSLDMLGEYMEYGFGNISSEAVVYIADEQMGQYVSGKMDEGTQLDYFYKQKDALLKKVAADQFIGNIYFLSDLAPGLSTAKQSLSKGYTSFINTEQGKAFLSDPSKCWVGTGAELDALTKVDSDSYAARVIKQFYKKEALLIIDVDKQAVLDSLNRIQPGEGSTLVFVAQDGQELYHDGSRGMELSKISYYEDATQSETDLGTIEDVDYNGAKSLFAYRKIGDTGCMVCAIIPNTVVTGQVSQIKYVVMGGIFISCVIALLVAVTISSGIHRTVKHMIKNMRKIAKGEMDVRMQLSGKSEFAQISEQMNQMLDSVTGFLSDVKKVSQQVFASAGNVNSSSSAIKESALYIATAMGDIQEGLSSQAEDTKSCCGQLDGLAASIGEVVERSEDIRNIAGNTEEYIDNSREAINSLKEKAEETSHITHDVIAKIDNLRAETGKIDQIIQTVFNIADETTMLSLNASIEAARAGEAGRGFSVVADEIRKLADQSMQSTQEIAAIVDDISNTTVLAVETAGKAGETIRRQEEAVDSALVAFGNMLEQLKQLMDMVAAINQSAESMSEQKEEALRNMESISVVTQTAVDEVVSVNERTVRQEDEVGKLAELSKEMEMQIYALEKSLQRFKLESKI